MDWSDGEDEMDWREEEMDAFFRVRSEMEKEGEKEMEDDGEDEMDWCDWEEEMDVILKSKSETENQKENETEESKEKENKN